MKKLLLSIFTLLSVLGLSSCGKNNNASSERTYIAAADANYRPFEWQNEKGEILGFDADIIQAIAKEEGFKVKYKHVPWEGLFNTLNQGTSDIVIAAVTITDKRKKSMDFSDAYFQANLLVAVGKDSNIKSLADLKTGKYKIGTQSGTTGDEVAKSLLGASSMKIKRFESISFIMDELKNGGVNAVIADNSVINYYMSQNNADFKTIEDASFNKDYFGIAVKKGNKEMLGKINAGLQKIKANGTYDKIYNKYFK